MIVFSKSVSFTDKSDVPICSFVFDGNVWCLLFQTIFSPKYYLNFSKIHSIYFAPLRLFRWQTFYLFVCVFIWVLRNSLFSHVLVTQYQFSPWLPAAARVAGRGCRRLDGRDCSARIIGRLDARLSVNIAIRERYSFKEFRRKGNHERSGSSLPSYCRHVLQPCLLSLSPVLCFTV